MNTSELLPSDNFGFFTRPVAVGALLSLPPEPKPKRPPSLAYLLTGSDFLSEFCAMGCLVGEAIPLFSIYDFAKPVRWVDTAFYSLSAAGAGFFAAPIPLISFLRAEDGLGPLAESAGLAIREPTEFLVPRPVLFRYKSLAYGIELSVFKVALEGACERVPATLFRLTPNLF